MLDEDYVLEKLFEIVLTLQQRFLFQNECSTMNVLSGIVSFGIMNGDCKVLNNNILNFSKLPLIKSPRDFED